MSALRQPLRFALRPTHRSPRPLFYRRFHASRSVLVVKSFLLADIGEGITECQLIQWFVQPGARVEQFDKLCEVQSDKASVEITSPFDGVIKELHYEPDDMCITGKPLVDIDIQGELSPEDEAKLGGGRETESGDTQQEAPEQRDEVEAEGFGAEHTPKPSSAPSEPPLRPDKGEVGNLATPAIRHLVKEHGLNVEDIDGSGRDGRVLKEDVHRHISQRGQLRTTATQPGPTSKSDRKVPLTPVQAQMFKTMTRSLAIPHFLYTCSADMTAITVLRSKLNSSAAPEKKTTPLAFIVKALSISLARHPILNASLDTRDTKKPELTHRGNHNFGIAIDTPSGLLVPVVKDVQDLSISEIASEMRRLASAARGNKLAPGDFSGATFTVSNIGSVGGGVVAPVISEPQVAIVGVGRSKIVPAFNGSGELIKREELILSWSADHRVVDGAECARCAEMVKTLLEEPANMLVDLR